MKEKVLVLIFVLLWLIVFITGCAVTINNSSSRIYNIKCYQNGQIILDEIGKRGPTGIHARTYPDGEFLQIPYGDSVECVYLPVE
jgi:hypothetical protein